MYRALRPVLFASAIVGSGTIGYCLKSYVHPPPPVVEPQKPPPHPVSSLYLNGVMLQCERKQDHDRIQKEQANTAQAEKYYQAMYQSLCTALIKGEDSASIQLQWESNMQKQVEVYAKIIEVRFKEQGLDVKLKKDDYFDDFNLVCTLQKPPTEQTKPEI